MSVLPHPSRLTRLIAAASIAALPIALLTTATASSASAATRPQAPAAGLAWHPLTLLHGWTPASSTLRYGHPAWAQKNGITYLSGALEQPSGFNSIFARLPRAARPAHGQVVLVYTDGDTTGYLSVTASGDLLLESNPQFDTQDFTSLAGISFASAHRAQHKFALLHGWKPASASVFGNPAYSVVGGVVYLSGAMSAPANSSNYFARLPKGARPGHVLIFLAYANDFSVGTVVINPDGSMFAYSNGTLQSKVFTSLANISFRASTTGNRALTLINGWHSAAISGSGTPVYAVAGGVVYLAGSLHQQAGPGKATFAVLPRAARPAHALRIKVWTQDDSVGDIEILPDGEVSSPDGPGRQALTLLAGVSYPLGA